MDQIDGQLWFKQSAIRRMLTSRPDIASSRILQSPTTAAIASQAERISSPLIC